VTPGRVGDVAHHRGGLGSGASGQFRVGVGGGDERRAELVVWGAGGEEAVARAAVVSAGEYGRVLRETPRHPTGVVIDLHHGARLVGQGLQGGSGHVCLRVGVGIGEQADEAFGRVPTAGGGGTRDRHQ
jgi:hypothetical protein